MILITGGAGYIGSHIAHMLFEQNRQILILDNLSSGFVENIPVNVPFINGDVGDILLVDKIINDYSVKSVIHFAANIDVEESMKNPFKYYKNNIEASQNLLEICVKYNVKNFVFSSSCAVYGTPKSNPIDENHIQNPQSPYATSKLITELMLKDLARTHKINYVILRYFNVGGAKNDLSLGDRKLNSSHLIGNICKAIIGLSEYITIYGQDYPTSDGTCIRDFIHIEDLSKAHILALEYLENGGNSEIFNCGYGYGYSVSEIINVFEQSLKIKIPIKYGDRREGDIIEIYNNPEKIFNKLKWVPNHNNLEEICLSSYKWMKKITDFTKQ